MTSRGAFWKWFTIATVASAALLWAQADALGGVAGLLQVGETSGLRPIIEAELGEIPLASGPGHDGQIYYAIGLDPGGDQVASLLDHGAYRYRRILYPLISSGFGLFDSQALLVGMIVVAIAAAGVAAGSVAALAARKGSSDWLALVVVLNPGVWLSLRLLTSDVLAISLMAAALLTLRSSRRLATGFFAASVLAKDVFIIVPAGLALSRDRRRWALLGVPVVVLGLWAAWLTFTMGEGFTGRGNLALPFQGIIEGARNWGNLDAAEWLYLLFALGSIGTGIVVGAARRSWLRWPILAWSLLGIVSSNWVWDFGNNAARAFAPIAVLIAVSGLGQEAKAAVLDSEAGSIDL